MVSAPVKLTAVLLLRDCSCKCVRFAGALLHRHLHCALACLYGFTLAKRVAAVHTATADSELYIFIRMLNHYRKVYQLWDQPLDEVTQLGGKRTRDDVYGFTRGQVLVILTNAQQERGWVPRRADVVLPPQLHNMILTNILDPLDVVTVDSNGSAAIHMRQDRQPQIYVPVAVHPATFGTPKGPAAVRTALHVRRAGFVCHGE